MKATGKTCGGNDGCGKPKRQGFPQPWKSLRDSHIPTARLLLYIFPKPIPKGVFLTACTFSLQAHPSIRKDCRCRLAICSGLRLRNLLCYDSRFVQLRHAQTGMVPRLSLGPPEGAAFASSGVTVCLTGNLGVVTSTRLRATSGGISPLRDSRSYRHARCRHGSYEGVLMEELRRRKHPQYCFGRALTLRQDLAHLCHVVYSRRHAAPRSRG